MLDLLLWFTVIASFFYAYTRTGLRAFWIMEIVLISYMITPLLMGFTDIDSFVMLSYTRIITPLLQIFSAVVILLAISNLSKFLKQIW